MLSAYSGVNNDIHSTQSNVTVSFLHGFQAGVITMLRKASFASAVYATANPSICLSVRLSHSGIMPKWQNMEGCSLHRRVAQCL